jgi:CSLREA domain-containing protein
MTKQRNIFGFVRLLCLLLIVVVNGSVSAQNKPTREPITPSKTHPVHHISGSTMATGPRAAPANDNFANAEGVSSLPFTRTINTFEDATIEAGEPDDIPSNPDPEIYATCDGQSLPTLSTAWYVYTPGSDTKVTIDLRGSNFDTVLVVWQLNGAASFANLTQIACNEDHTLIVVPQSVIYNLSLTGGTTYYIQVMGLEDTEDPLPAGSTLQFSVKETLPAATFNVNTTADTQDANLGNGTCADAAAACSLRAAVMEANELQPGSIINIPAGTYNLGINNAAMDPKRDENAALTGDLDIFTSMTLNGAGADQTILDAFDADTADRDRFFHLLKRDDSTAAPVVTLNNITIRNGLLDTTDYNSFGGGIFVELATLNLNNVFITDNQAVSGGGIAASGATLTINNSTLFRNVAVEYDELVTNQELGGGIYAVSGLIASTITLTNTTLSDNTGVFGGGIYMTSGGSLTTNYVTIAANGSINETVGAKTLTTEQGGGIYLASGVSATLNATLISDNAATNAPDCSGTVFSGGDNLFSNKTGCTGLLGSDITATRPAVVVPATVNLPGNMPTHMLASDSQAIDAANTPCPATDQRSISRPRGAKCDIGAIESRGATPDTPVLVSPANGQEFNPPLSLTQFTWNTVSDVSFYTFRLRQVGSGVIQSEVVDASACGATCTVALAPDTITSFGDFSWSVTATLDSTSDPAQFTFSYSTPNLVVNGSFEASVAGKPALPQKWKPVNRTKDKRFCNNVNKPAYDQSCAYYFKGSANENSRLIQTIKFSGDNPTGGDVIQASAFLRTGSTGRGKIRVVIIYTNGNILGFNMPFASPQNNKTYRRLTGNFTVKDERTVEKIKVKIQNKSLSGQLAVDNVRVWVEPVP